MGQELLWLFVLNRPTPIYIFVFYVKCARNVRVSNNSVDTSAFFLFFADSGSGPNQTKTQPKTTNKIDTKTQQEYILPIRIEVNESVKLWSKLTPDHRFLKCFSLFFRVSHFFFVVIVFFVRVFILVQIRFLYAHEKLFTSSHGSRTIYEEKGKTCVSLMNHVFFFLSIVLCCFLNFKWLLSFYSVFIWSLLLNGARTSALYSIAVSSFRIDFEWKTLHQNLFVARHFNHFNCRTKAKRRIKKNRRVKTYFHSFGGTIIVCPKVAKFIFQMKLQIRIFKFFGQRTRTVVYFKTHTHNCVECGLERYVVINVLIMIYMSQTCVNYYTSSFHSKHMVH